MSSKRYTPEFRAVVIRQGRVKSYLRVRTPKVDPGKLSCQMAYLKISCALCLACDCNY